MSAIEGTLLYYASLYRHCILISNIGLDVAWRMLCSGSACFSDFGLGLQLAIEDAFPNTGLAADSDDWLDGFSPGFVFTCSFAACLTAALSLFLKKI